MDASSEAEPCTCGFSACRKHCDARRSSRESLLTREGTQPIEFSHASGVLQTFVGSADRVHCQSEPPGHKVVADMLLSMLPLPTLSLEGPPAMASTCSCPLLFPGGPPSGNCPHMPQACSSLDPNDPTLFIGSTTDPFRQPYTPEQRWRFLASHMRQHGAGAMYAADRDRRRGLPTLHSPQISLTGAQLRETAATEDRLSSVARHSLGSSGSGRITSSGGDFQCGKCFACKQGASLLGAGECSKRQSLCLRSISTRPSRSAADQSSSHFPQKITIEVCIHMRLRIGLTHVCMHLSSWGYFRVSAATAWCSCHRSLLHVLSLAM